MTDELFRVYSPDELGTDGYPLVWHRVDVGSHPYASPGERWAPGIKDLVRDRAGYRCVRCRHPYRNGTHGNGEWSPCDPYCTHGSPVRHVTGSGSVDLELPDGYVAGRHPAAARQRLLARWRILTVHHLDGNKANCRWHNLVALCQRDHLAIQGKVVMDRPWPWEHTPWFRPYVAAFYALKYLGEELDRPTTELRLEELLTLGKARESEERMPL